MLVSLVSSSFLLLASLGRSVKSPLLVCSAYRDRRVPCMQICLLFVFGNPQAWGLRPFSSSKFNNFLCESKTIVTPTKHFITAIRGVVYSLSLCQSRIDPLEIYHKWFRARRVISISGPVINVGNELASAPIYRIKLVVRDVSLSRERARVHQSLYTYLLVQRITGADLCFQRL